MTGGTLLANAAGSNTCFGFTTSTNNNETWTINDPTALASLNILTLNYQNNSSGGTSTVNLQNGTLQADLDPDGRHGGDQLQFQRRPPPADGLRH